MAKDCGPSAAQEKLTATINSAKGTTDGLIADATNGIATQVSGLASQISGLTDGIKADLDIAAPELPKPAFTLQGQMTNLLNNADNPGALVQQMDEIREKFGDKVNVDKMFDDFGLDATELKNLNDDYKSKLAEGNKLQELQSKGAGLTDSVSADLIALASGDLSAIGKLIGGAADKIFGGNSKADLLDNVCTNIPNLEMDADGNVIEKGPETIVPEKDAVVDEDRADVKADIEPEVIDTSTENIDNLTTTSEETEEPDVEPLDFGPPIEPELSVREEFKKDNERLAELQEQAREQRAGNRKTKGKVPRHEIYFTNALNRLIDFYSKNLNIKYTIKAVDNPEKFEDTKFKIRNQEYMQKRAKLLEERGIVINGSFFERTFKQPPPGANLAKLTKVVQELRSLEYVKILEL